MHNPANRSAGSRASRVIAQPGGFNHNKLQAAFCILSSSLVSMALIVWACKNIF